MVYTVTHDVASKDDKAPSNKPEVTASVIVHNKYHSAFTLQKPVCSCPGLPHICNTEIYGLFKIQRLLQSNKCTFFQGSHKERLCSQSGD